MIDRARLGRLLGLVALLLAASVLASLAVDRSLGLAGGLVLGAALGAAPFVSWSLILSHGLARRRDRVIAVLLGAGKLGLYAFLLYFFVTRSLVRPLGVFLGMTGVIGVLTVGALLGPPRRTGEAV